jgi:hypothetical protein
MVDNKKQQEPIFKRVIPKLNKAGDRQIGSISVELKEFESYKFIQITQVKESFGYPGSEIYKPGKTTWITLDPTDIAVQQAIQDCYDSFLNN